MTLAEPDAENALDFLSGCTERTECFDGNGSSTS